MNSCIVTVQVKHSETDRNSEQKQRMGVLKHREWEIPIFDVYLQSSSFKRVRQGNFPVENYLGILNKTLAFFLARVLS